MGLSKTLQDTNQIKGLLKTKMTTTNAEWTNLTSKVEDSKRKLATIEDEVRNAQQVHDEQARIFHEENTTQVQQFHKLQEQMKDIQQEMLIDEEAIVEQRREYDELLRDIEHDKKDWIEQKQQRIKNWEMEESQQQEMLEKSLRDQVTKAKQELSTLETFLTSQKETLQKEYEARVYQMDQMGKNMNLLKHQFTKEKMEFEEEKHTMASKRKHLDALVGRLDRSEQQYKERQEESEWEVARLNSLLRTEQESFQKFQQQQSEQHATAINKLRETHNENIQKLASQVGSLEAERKNLDRESNSFKEKFEELKKDSTDKIESIKKVKESIEGQLARSLEKIRTYEQVMENLQHEQNEQNDKDTTERKKMQILMKRLEENGAAVAAKQKEVDDRERLVKDAMNDLERRSNNMIKTEQNMMERNNKFTKDILLERKAWEEERKTKKEGLEKELTIRTENFDAEFSEKRNQLKEDWKKQ